MKKTKRQACLLLAFLLVLSVGALMQEPEQVVTVEQIDTDNLIPGEVNEQNSAQAWYLCNSVKKAGENLRKAMTERKTKVTIMLSGKASSAAKADCNAVFDEIYEIALMHTGTGNEGDYLKWHFSKPDVRFSKSTSTYRISIPYWDDADKEEQTTKAIAAVEKSLDIAKGDSDYQKIYKIYDYLARHITYDDTDQSTLPHTAYAAIVNGRAVCQGYATLFYRMLLDYGIDNRIIVSSDHAWNLVCLDGKYYECDLTWDSQGVERGLAFEYFLKADLSKGDNKHNWKLSVLGDDVSLLSRASSDYVPKSVTKGKAARKKKRL